MPALDIPRLVRQSSLFSPWALGNEVLYALCREHPRHSNLDAVIAKIWLIGRSYAAAIERRRNKVENELNDDFYLKSAGPAIIDSGIDHWIDAARGVSPDDPGADTVSLQVHAETTKLFKQISGMDKRSLASKYLHFHVPDLFFIYDKRAVEAMSLLSGKVGRAGGSSGPGDNEYRKFVVKCVRLTDILAEEFGRRPTPRELDNFLLAVHAFRKPN